MDDFYEKPIPAIFSVLPLKPYQMFQIRGKLLSLWFFDEIGHLHRVMAATHSIGYENVVNMLCKQPELIKKL